ncbi:fumarylacetoacetase, partial [Streptomyces ipomoeae]|nr:fumarylacetoacetase [Streptomyces ipomoeae]
MPPIDVPEGDPSDVSDVSDVSNISDVSDVSDVSEGGSFNAPEGRGRFDATAGDPFDIPEGHPFGPHNLPYGVFSPVGSETRTVGVRLGDHVLDAGAAARALGSPYATL